MISISNKLNPVSASFRSSDLEHSYRQSYLSVDRIQAILTICIVAIPVITFSISDYQLFGASFEFYKLMIIRAALMILSFAIIAIVFKAKQESIFDAALSVWLFFLCNFQLYVASTRPRSFVFHLAIDIAMLMALYAIVPLRFVFQIASAFYFTVLSIYINLNFRDHTIISQRAVWVCFFFVNLCGLWTSWRMHIDRRTQFDSLLAEKHLAHELKTAIEKIRTLKDLLPICSSCKKIRDDDGYWHQVESYIYEHTDTKFSHGICPDCMETLYPQFSKTQKAS